MIGITKLYCGTATPGDALRYGRESGKMPAHLLQYSSDKKPVVVWNMSRRCNLRCVHCYSDSENKEYEGELTTREALDVIADLGEFGAPVLLFSGGEPLMREDLFELAEFAAKCGIRPVISTNGTLITDKMAKRIKETGFGYVGISLDGIGDINDKFRGVKGAFNAAMRGFEACVNVGQKVGLRLTMTRRNYGDLNAIFDFIEEEKIPRACFYHLVYIGRGSDMVKDDLAHEESRKAMDLIMDRTVDFHRRGLEKDILTVDNHCDGPYLYMRMLQEGSERAEEVMQLLQWNGGNSSGVGIGCIDNCGDVHADQFWQEYTFGNVRERKFSEIWMDTSDPVMAGLKNRKPILKGRCAQTNCKWIDVCNGNFRSRAIAVHGDTWAEDPACYLTDEEIAK
ncbi:MAG: radical SAM protein [Armatimonadetes bacterium]|nr:radical SAM protein [Armatimonadota bacterium]